jgi:hypothetical protein
MSKGKRKGYQNSRGRVRERRPRCGGFNRLFSAAAPAAAAHRRVWHRATFRTWRRRRRPDHPQARKQLSKVRAFAGGTCRGAIGSHKRLEWLSAITTFVFEEGHKSSLRHRDRRGPQHIITDRIPVTYHADHTPVVLRRGCRHGRDRFMPKGIEMGAFAVDALDPYRLQL